MDFDQLETFIEVARLSSFSRAAEKRFRTQPAISSQIRSLEEEVGARLLDRSGGKVSLTASGKLFLKFAEDSIDARKSAVTAIAETERVPRGEIVVGANEGTCLHVLPEVFAEFKKQYPKVAVSIQRSEHAKIMESVIDNFVDFGVVSLPVDDSRLTIVVIHNDELVLISPPTTGERIIPRWVFEAIPPEKLDGYTIEYIINGVIAERRLPVTARVMTGVTHRTKRDKLGRLEGTIETARMFWDVISVPLRGLVRFRAYVYYLRALTIEK